jgi:hypothetical protein
MPNIVVVRLYAERWQQRVVANLAAICASVATAQTLMHQSEKRKIGRSSERHRLSAQVYRIYKPRVFAEFSRHPAMAYGPSLIWRRIDLDQGCAAPRTLFVASSTSEMLLY